MTDKRDNYCTTFISKDGGYSYGAGKQHYLGEEGDRNHAAIRRNLGFAKQMGLAIEFSSPTKRDLLAIGILIRTEG